jgi:hypothetical protein
VRDLHSFRCDRCRPIAIADIGLDTSTVWNVADGKSIDNFHAGAARESGWSSRPDLRERRGTFHFAWERASS